VEGVAVNSAFWRGRRVFLTGHTGFKGGWLALWLQALGAEVHGYALAPPTNPNLFEVARVEPGMASSVLADIRDAQSLGQAMAQAQPEVVFHLAAQSLVRYSYAQPVETYDVNVMGTVQLLEAVRATASVKAVVAITTDKCYENREWVWGYREHEAMGGADPYSSSKACAELVTAAYRRSFLAEQGAAVAPARAGNVIGGGDWAADRLIPDLLRSVFAGQPVVIRHPGAIRPWQHVLDPLAGYLTLAERLHDQGAEFAEGWNFGPGDNDARPVQWIVEQLTAQWGGGATWRLDERTHPHEANTLRLDCSKARTRLPWQPVWALPVALEKILAWHRAHRAGEDMHAFTLRQIAEYQALQPGTP
jgi:CDP-glucose 4,6-dehydratase